MAPDRMMTAARAFDRAVERPRSVYIVLATYNGAAYLVEQIESIRSQTFTAWRLLVRDDGSTDATVTILDDYAAKDPRIEIVRDDADNLGPAGNFSRLSSLALERGASAVFFADQDDVWFPGKVARTLEAHASCRGPARTRSCDPRSHRPAAHKRRRPPRSIGRSWSFSAFTTPRSRALTTLLAQNYVTGCAMAVNRPLLRLALPIPEAALMHDWWLALCAAACGSLEFLPEATAAYRRHGANAVTVRGFRQTMNPLRTDWQALWRTGQQNHARAVRQAAALAGRMAEKGGALNCASGLVDAFVRIHDPERSSVSRVAGALRLGLRSQALPRTLALYLRLLRWRM